MIQFLQNYGAELLVKIGEHIYISFFALSLGIIVAVPLGILLTRFDKIASFVIGIASVLQTVPSLAILALMIPLLGIGTFPAIIALFVYSLLPILRNTYLGIKNVDPNLKDVAKGMGMTPIQTIWIVEIPLAMPVIMAGIRLGAVYVISWATLAAYIGAGGLGDFIFNGLNIYQTDLILGGAIPVTILAMLADYLLGLLDSKLSPAFMRTGK